MAGAAGRSAGGLAGGGGRGFAAGRYPYPKCLHSELLVFVAESRASLLSLKRQLICSEKDILKGIFFSNFASQIQNWKHKIETAIKNSASSVPGRMPKNHIFLRPGKSGLMSSGKYFRTNWECQFRTCWQSRKMWIKLSSTLCSPEEISQKVHFREIFGTKCDSLVFNPKMLL